MKGGTRSNKRIFPHSVHRLQPNYANTIRNALEKMTPHERVEAYIEMIATRPMNDHNAENLQIFKDIFRDESIFMMMFVFVIVSVIVTFC